VVKQIMQRLRGPDGCVVLIQGKVIGMVFDSS